MHLKRLPEIKRYFMVACFLRPGSLIVVGHSHHLAQFVRSINTSARLRGIGVSKMKRLLFALNV
jgi:hypothetical protein